jgi:hypothetical protein
VQHLAVAIVDEGDAAAAAAAASKPPSLETVGLETVKRAVTASKVADMARMDAIADKVCHS